MEVGAIDPADQIAAPPSNVPSDIAGAVKPFETEWNV